jgi:hypothetical protein
MSSSPLGRASPPKPSWRRRRLFLSTVRAMVLHSRYLRPRGLFGVLLRPADGVEVDRRGV